MGPDEQFVALLHGCVVVKAPWLRRIRVIGPDAQRWLNGMVTNNTTDLAPGEGCYAFLLNAQGHIVGDIVVFRTEDRDGHAAYTLQTDAAQLETITAWLDRYIIMDDVTLESSDSESALILSGNTAAQVLGVEPGDLQLNDVDVDGITGQAYRDGSLNRDTYVLWTIQPDALLEKLLARGAQPADTLALEWLRIASGVPKFGVDIRARDLPQETGQQRALHFKKGCYLGQEIVERIHARGSVHRGLTLFALDAPPQGELPLAVLDGESEIGHVTSVATVPLPDGTRTVALGIVRTAAVIAGRPLTAGGIAATAQRGTFL